MATYLLVADSGTARIFRRDGKAGAKSMTEMQTLISPPARTATRDLVADRTGRVLPRASRAIGARSPAPHGADSESDPHTTERQRFARRIARQLDIERRSGKLASLVVISPPRFLGTLREALSGATRKVVEREIARDWVRLPPREILRRVRATRP